MEYFYHRFARYSELPIVPELFQISKDNGSLARDGDSTGAFQFNIVSRSLMSSAMRFSWYGERALVTP